MPVGWKPFIGRATRSFNLVWQCFFSSESKGWRALGFYFPEAQWLFWHWAFGWVRQGMKKKVVGWIAGCHTASDCLFALSQFLRTVGIERASSSLYRFATYTNRPFSKDQGEKKNAVVKSTRAAHATRVNSQMMVTPSFSKWWSTINRRTISIQAPSPRFPWWLILISGTIDNHG